jgi:hypothetical protein
MSVVEAASPPSSAFPSWSILPPIRLPLSVIDISPKRLSVIVAPFRAIIPDALATRLIATPSRPYTARVPLQGI